jgi:hypothetical protein
LSAIGNDYETPPGGSRSYISTAFTANIHYSNSLASSDLYVDRADSWSYWAGGNPYNATQVCLNDTWETTGWAFTPVTVSIPPGAGAGFSTSGSSISWHCPSVLTNTYRIEHITTGVHFSGYEINGFQETAQEDMLFSYVWYSNYEATKGIH